MYSKSCTSTGSTSPAPPCSQGGAGARPRARAGRLAASLLKTKCVQAQEFVVTGYVASTAGAAFVGSLALGYYERGKLTYAGRVGTGWSRELSRSLRETIEKLHVPQPPFDNPLPKGGEARM
jgi:bifunctional non-homologous end joining protein LigD